MTFFRYRSNGPGSTRLFPHRFDAATTRTKSVAIAKEWLRELEKGTSKDGHDQMPLRKVLYRHRNDVYDLPARVQRRGLSHSPCDGEPLLWHAHRADRVKWARIHKKGAAEVCGFVV